MNHQKKRDARYRRRAAAGDVEKRTLRPVPCLDCAPLELGGLRHRTCAREPSCSDGDPQPPADENGVPLCTCRRYDDAPDARPYMDLRNVEDRWGPEQRAKHNIAPGRRCPGPPHGFGLRWKCPHATPKSKGCGLEYTRADHWGYTQVLPLAGDSPEAKLRSARLLSRNRVESSFSALKRLGIGNNQTERAEWTDEHELDWVLSAAIGAHEERAGALRALGHGARPPPGSTLLRASERRVSGTK